MASGLRAFLERESKQWTREGTQLNLNICVSFYCVQMATMKGIMAFVVFLMLPAKGNCASLSGSSENLEWKAWMNRHERSYNDGDEESFRRAVWLQNSKASLILINYAFLESKMAPMLSNSQIFLLRSFFNRRSNETESPIVALPWQRTTWQI